MDHIGRASVGKEYDDHYEILAYSDNRSDFLSEVKAAEAGNTETLTWEVYLAKGGLHLTDMNVTVRGKESSYRVLADLRQFVPTLKIALAE